MQKIIVAFFALFLLGTTAYAQKYFTRDAKVKFSSETPMEKIEALNKSGTCVLDAATGKMEWKVLIKGFLFEKALMQEHFNENYMESSTYPNAQFKGQITNLNEVNFAKDGKYNAVVTGKLTIHGVTKDITTNGALTVANGTIKLNAGFSLLMGDYGIDIPSLVSDKVAKEAKILIDAALEPMK
jgi:uncharacterized protein YdeI (BOF family)